MLLTVQGGSIHARHIRFDGGAFVWFEDGFTPNTLPHAALTALEPAGETLLRRYADLTLTGLARGILIARLTDALPYLLHPDSPERLFTLHFADGNAALVSASRDAFAQLLARMTT